MNTKQVQWAQQHDWHVKTLKGTTTENLIVLVRDWEQDVEGAWQPMQRTFTDYIKLREWAGY